VKVTGKIKKVIPNHSGTWYYLDSGSTINGQWIITINGQPL
jgi:glucan-binding YG repeat protein